MLLFHNGVVVVVVQIDSVSIVLRIIVVTVFFVVVFVVVVGRTVPFILVWRQHAWHFRVVLLLHLFLDRVPMVLLLLLLVIERDWFHVHSGTHTSLATRTNKKRQTRKQEEDCVLKMPTTVCVCGSAKHPSKLHIDLAQPLSERQPRMFRRHNDKNSDSFLRSAVPLTPHLLPSFGYCDFRQTDGQTENALVRCTLLLGEKGSFLSHPCSLFHLASKPKRPSEGLAKDSSRMSSNGLDSNDGAGTDPIDVVIEKLLR